MEFISKVGNRIHGEVVESFLSGLYWRGKNEIGPRTIQEIDKIWKENNENDIRRTIFGLLAVSTKINCPVNAEYIHEKLSRMNNYSRDYFLSFF